MVASLTTLFMWSCGTSNATAPPLDGGEAGAPVDADLATTEDSGPLTFNKWALWTHGTQLRGANVWQRRVYPELDDDSLGPGPVGPPMEQSDFDRLAALGANYVNLSHPGVFDEAPPYAVNEAAQANLDRLLAMALRADLFVVITFRTGPGRSEFWAYPGEDTTADPEHGWFDPSYYNHRVWTDADAQTAWAQMWGYAAERYRGHPAVVGYDLMCEPNAGDVFFDAWEGPSGFYPEHAGSRYDWNRLYPHLVSAIREVDSETPILVQPMGYGAVSWLSALTPTDDARTVYTVHAYEPSEYVYQSNPSRRYPGHFDADGDGMVDDVGPAWIDSLLQTVRDYARAHGAPTASNEFGVIRWQPGAARYVGDFMDAFERQGMNYAIWDWATSWEPFSTNDDFCFRHGPNRDNHRDLPNAELDAIRRRWRRNERRPSNVGSLGSAG